MASFNLKHTEFIAKVTAKVVAAAEEIGQEEVADIQAACSVPYPPASPPGSPPAMRTGELVAGIGHSVQKGSGEVTLTMESNAPHASHLEFGTVKMAARPHMRPSLDSLKATFMSRMATKLKV